MTVDELKSLLSRFRIRPDKKLGQNFLLTESVLDEIIEAADLTSQDQVLEIGPGLGFLTRRLAEQAGSVIAVEKDRKLCQALRKIFKNRKNVKIINDDALRFDPISYQLQAKSYKVVANIPYYITGMILQKLLSPSVIARSETTKQSRDSGIAARPSDARNDEQILNRPALIVLLLQKEVADRIAAKPGDMSVLSISVQFYADPEVISYVGKENFYPVPEVDSAIVRITPLSSPLSKGGKRGVRFDVDERKFFQLVKIGFSNKRKQLHNNLQAGFGPGRNYKETLQSLGLNPLVRAQDLSLENWKRLYEILVEH